MGSKKVLDFRKSLEDSRQVLYHGFANEAEFKAEVDRHLRAFAKGELPPADAPRDKVLLPLAVLAEVQKEKAEKEQALARAEQRRWISTTLLETGGGFLDDETCRVTEPLETLQTRSLARSSIGKRPKSLLCREYETHDYSQLK